MVFLGTCLGISSDKRVTANLYRSRSTRCFNAVLVRRSAAVKALEYGSITDDFLPVDWLFDKYIPELDLVAYFAEPPLAYELSKTVVQYPCNETDLIGYLPP